MPSVHKLIPRGRGLAGVLLARAPSVELDWTTRRAGSFDAVDSSGRALSVTLPAGTVLRGGDVLVADDGSLVRVLAAAQAVLELRACPQHGSASDLARAAFHLGRRGVSVQVAPDHLSIEPGADAAPLLEALHLVVAERSAAFEPEADEPPAPPHRHGAACASGHAHAHAPGHGHCHGHGHEHDHGHGHDHDHAAAAPHVHGPGCGHDHAGHAGHGHDHRHDHRHDHGHDHGPAHEHGHAHGHAHHPHHDHPPR